MQEEEGRVEEICNVICNAGGLGRAEEICYVICNAGGRRKS